MSTFVLERANLSARIGVKTLTGRAFERASLLARIGVESLTGRVDVFVGKSKSFRQDWGTGKAVDGSC